MRFRFLIAFLALASPLAGQTLPQPTARDTAFKKKFYDEANRTNGPRKTVIKKLADSLVMATPAPPPIPAAPIADFTAKCDTTFLCQFDATKSTGYKLSYLWDCGALPNCVPGNTAAFGFKYPHEGDRTTVLTVRDSLARTNAKTLTFTVPKPDTVIPIPPPDTTTPPPPADTTLGIVPPALPRSVPDFQPKPCIRSVDVLAGANLQTALNAAQPGDCLELAPGATWQGNFKLPTRTCTSATQWITIRTKGVLDVPGTRMDSVQAKGFARIINANNQYAIGTTDPTQCWQIMHLNLQRDPAATVLVYHLIVLGFSGSDGNTSIATNPKDIILRRNWIHGTATGELVRCVAVNGIRIAIVDNFIDDCHATGFDSQAIEGWNGAGPILIQNNFLAGAGENVMFGGADPADSTLNPSDITIRRNHFMKRLEWKDAGFSIKNGFELKNARRVLVDANVWSPCAWVKSQVGMCIVIKTSTGGANSTVEAGTTDLTFTNNWTDQSNRGFNVMGQDCTAQACGPGKTMRTNRVLVQNNLFTNIGTSNGIVGNDGWLILATSAPQNVLLRSNTFVGNTPGKGLAFYISGDSSLWNNFRFRKNVLAGQGYYAIGADCQKPTHAAALDCLIGPGRWTFDNNLVSEVDQTFWSKYPATNTMKVTIGELGLTNDYRVPNFPGVGADITALNAKIAGVVTTPTPLAGRKPPRATAPPIAPRYTSEDIEWCRRNACSLPLQP